MGLLALLSAKELEDDKEQQALGLLQLSSAEDWWGTLYGTEQAVPSYC